MVFPLKDTMPAARAPVVTLGLIAPTVVLFAVAGQGGWVAPGGILHAVATVLFLWIFGATLEDTLGRATYVVLFVLGGVVAVAAVSATGASPAVAVVGAAGAVSAVLGAYVALYPRGRVLSAVFMVLVVGMLELPMLVFAGLWWAVQMTVFAVADDAMALGGLLGGFALGLATARLLARPKPIAPAPYRVA